MRPTLSLFRREFSAYFYSPIAYVVLAIFLAVTGHLFYLSLELLTSRGPKGISYPMELIVNSVPFWLVFLALAPLLTMRLFAEERSTGTLEMLLTAPLRDWQVVLAKFVACYAFYVIMWLPTLLYLPVLTDWQWWTVHCGIDPWPIVTTYIGLALAGAMFLSIGLFISSLVNSQMVAALVSIFLGLLFIVGGIWKPDMDTSATPYRVLSFFTIPLHFESNFGRGVIDTRNLILYSSVALLGLFLTVRSLESRRWR
jgi:ABC-2 type transport system permease protein